MAGQVTGKVELPAFFRSHVITLHPCSTRFHRLRLRVSVANDFSLWSLNSQPSSLNCPHREAAGLRKETTAGALSLTQMHRLLRERHFSPAPFGVLSRAGNTPKLRQSAPSCTKSGISDSAFFRKIRKNGKFGMAVKISFFTKNQQFCRQPGPESGVARLMLKKISFRLNSSPPWPSDFQIRMKFRTLTSCNQLAFPPISRFLPRGLNW